MPALAVAGGLVVALVVAHLVPAASGGRSHPSAAAVTRYEKAIIGPVKDWGSVEVLGMRPSVPDLLGGKNALPAAAVAEEARAWVAAFTHDRALIAAVEAPPGLGKCRSLLLQALDKYLESARTFGRAAATPLAQRHPVIESAIASASAGDLLFDRASAILQRARVTAGLELSPDFPQPTPTS